MPAPFDASCRGREGLKHGMRETLDHVLAGAAVDALLLAGLVSHLVSGCATKSFRRLALNRLLRVTRVSAAARDLVGHAGFVSLLGVAERGTTLASLVIPVLMNTASSASVSTAVLGEVILPTLRRLLALGSRFPSCTVFGLVDYLLLNAPAATQAFLECGIVAWLDMHLEQGFCRARDDPWVARALIQISIRFLDTPDHREAVLPLYRYFPSALSLFLRLTSSDDLAKLVINAARGLYLSTFDASIHRTAIAVSLLIDKPGALASLAHLAFVRPPQLHDQYAKLIARCLMRTYLAPQAFLFPSMLDEFFTLPALCSVDFEPPDAARLMAICTTPVALHYLTQPLARQRVCAAASLAHFANLDDLFVGHLADGAHLNALLDAAIEAATAPADAAAVMPGGSSREWHTTALLSAVSLAARACRVTTPAAAAAAEDKKHTRRKRPRVGMDASDVGVQHRSSTFPDRSAAILRANHCVEKGLAHFEAGYGGGGQQPRAHRLASRDRRTCKPPPRALRPGCGVCVHGRHLAAV